MNRLIKSAASVLLAMSTLAFFSCDDESDVIGLNDATKYGYIKITLEGTDPNGDEFEVTKNFKFSPSGSPENSSTVYWYDDNGFYEQFNVTRYLGPLNGGDGNDSYANLYLYNYQEDGFNFSESSLYFTTSVITDNKEFFGLSEYIYIYNEDVTSYSYNAETGKLSLKFSTTLEDSDTDYPLTVTVNVNVTVFESLNQQQEF